MTPTQEEVPGPSPQGVPRFKRGDYVVDTRPEGHSPPDDPWIARVQMPLYDGTCRLVTPHGIEWPAPVTKLRDATDDERDWFDEHVPPRAS